MHTHKWHGMHFFFFTYTCHFGFVAPESVRVQTTCTYCTSSPHTVTHWVQSRGSSELYIKLMGLANAQIHLDTSKMTWIKYLTINITRTCESKHWPKRPRLNLKSHIPVVASYIRVVVPKVGVWSLSGGTKLLPLGRNRANEDSVLGFFLYPPTLFNMNTTLQKFK